MKDTYKKLIDEYYKEDDIKLIVKEQMKDSNFQKWEDLIVHLKDSFKKDVYDTSSAFMPCYSCEFVIDAKQGDSLWFARTIQLKKSFIDPYWSIYGMFMAFEKTSKENISHKPSMITSDKGIYGEFMRAIKAEIHSLNKNASFVSHQEMKKPYEKYDLAYCNGKQSYYNYFFSSLDFEDFHNI